MVSKKGADIEICSNFVRKVSEAAVKGGPTFSRLDYGGGRANVATRQLIGMESGTGREVRCVAVF
jgi:hypothetical protein